MSPSTSTPKSIRRDLDRAWKLLNELAGTLSRIATDTENLASMPAAKAAAGRPRKGAGAAKAGRKGAAGPSKAAEGLPDTTGDFFARHVKKRKQTAPQIYQSVIGSLDFEPSKEQAAILRNRLAVWLSNATKSESNPISSIGSGKERRYYRA